MAAGGLLAFFLAGCSVIQPAPRERLVKNLRPIIALEERANRVTRSVSRLAFLGKINEKDASALKENYDLYYVYHQGAAVSLAQGNLAAYRSHVQLAESELDAMEMRLRGLFTSSEDESEAQKPVASTFEL